LFCDLASLSQLGNINWLTKLFMQLPLLLVIKFDDILKFENAVKPVYNDNPWDPNILAIDDRWSLFRGSKYYKNWNWAFQVVAFVGRWSLFRDIR
jgi:hypothetical protein